MRRLVRLQNSMKSVAAGDLATEIATGGSDEIADMAEALQVFKDNMLESNRLRAERAEAEKHTRAQRRSEMQKLADEFEAAVGEIVQTVSSASTELEASATSLTKTAEHTQQLSGRVEAASEEASSNVRSVAAATEEMTASIAEISRQVQESNLIAGEAVNQAEATDARINELSKAALRIGDVVDLITTIAEQTNLLALNATIEAARAGDAGRGFAVVAQEVKALAAQTAKATNEISSQIAGMQVATQESVLAIKQIGTTISRISQIAATIATSVDQQGGATQEIAHNVEQAAQGTSEVASNIVDVNNGARETGAASAQVLCLGAVPVRGKQSPQARGRQVSRHGARGLSGSYVDSRTGRIELAIKPVDRGGRIAEGCANGRAQRLELHVAETRMTAGGDELQRLDNRRGQRQRQHDQPESPGIGGGKQRADRRHHAKPLDVRRQSRGGPQSDRNERDHEDDQDREPGRAPDNQPDGVHSEVPLFPVSAEQLPEKLLRLRKLVVVDLRRPLSVDVEIGGVGDPVLRSAETSRASAG